MRKIRLGHCEVLPQDYDRVNQVLSCAQISPGPFCREFEGKFAALYKADHALFVNSGTDALRLALLAMKEKFAWRDGMQVAVPALTFVATVNVILQAGLEPFFVDVGMYDYNMNPANLERRLEDGASRVVAILPVHLFGQQANMHELLRVARTHDLRILEDSCEAVGAGPLWGDVACFSTYQAHILATGVGGLIITQDDYLHEIMRSLANHGRDPVYLPGYRAPELSQELIHSRFRFVRSGYSSRASEFEAAIGLGQLERLNVNLDKRRRLANALIGALANLPDLKLPVPVDPRLHSYMMFPVVLKETSKAKKEELVWHLESSGIETRDMMPITTQPTFAKYFKGSSFTVAEWINKNGFYVPCHPGMTHDDVGYLIETFKEFFRKT